MLIINHNGLNLKIREGTTDEKVVVEVLKKQVYRRTNFLEIQPEDYWADLGANIGSFSLLAASKGARVLAFEPEPSNFQMLSENMSLNPKFEIGALNWAVTAEEKTTVDLYLCRRLENRYRHTLFKKKGREKIEVGAHPFKDILKAGITAIKMDIEGEELNILDREWDWGKVKKLVFEYHFDLDRSIPRFLKRVARLKYWFPNIYFGKIPETETYDFYPAARIVYCRK